MPDNKEGAKKILLVEDDLSMRAIVARKLKAHNYNVVEAQNGKQGLELCVKEKPDLVILDLMIPEMDGFEVLKAIRENPDKKIAEVPMIVLSNLYSNEHIVKAQSYKIQGYFVKAYLTTDDILKEVNKLLGKG